MIVYEHSLTVNTVIDRLKKITGYQHWLTEQIGYQQWLTINIGWVWTLIDYQHWPSEQKNYLLSTFTTSVNYSYQQWLIMNKQWLIINIQWLTKQTLTINNDRLWTNNNWLSTFIDKQWLCPCTISLTPFTPTSSPFATPHRLVWDSCKWFSHLDNNWSKYARKFA